jgi:hypothetical protein
MIDLDSVAGLLEHVHGLAACCPCCGHWAVLSPADLAAQGQGSLRLPITVKCRDCVEVGRSQVRPPRYVVRTDAHPTRRTSRFSHYAGDIGTATFT